MRVDFITFCCPKDISRLHEDGELRNRVVSHKHSFDQIILIKQRCRDIGGSNIHFEATTIELESEDYHPGILSEFGIREDDSVADEWTHGPGGAHYWKWHVINHLIGLKVSNADYIVFSDCDCRIKSSPEQSWIDKGIEILCNHREVLIVSPSDGGHMFERRLSGNVRLTQNVSQQVFLCERERLKSINFDIPWDWEFLAPGGPMQEFYYMLEGRLWRWMHHNGLYRAILPKAWRYWHDGWH